jgi:hypothetical protein
MNIETPQEFRDICRNMGPRFGEFATSKEDLARSVLIGVDEKAAQVIVKFLKELVANHTPGGIKD